MNFIVYAKIAACYSYNHMYMERGISVLSSGFACQIIPYGDSMMVRPFQCNKSRVSIYRKTNIDKNSKNRNRIPSKVVSHLFDRRWEKKK